MKFSKADENKIGIVYNSFSCSEKMFSSLFRNAELKPGQAVQKYNRLIMEGIAVDQKVEVNAVTEVPITEENYKYKIFKNNIEKINNINYIYVGVINVHLIKDILAVFSSLLTAVSIIKKYNKRVVISDILNAPVALGGYIASRITKTDYIAIVTDLPIYGGSGKAYKIVSDYLIKHADKYVFITEEMNCLLNNENRPYLIIEGLVDCDENIKQVRINNEKKIIMYTGSIMKKYGIGNLVQGFIKANIDDAELHIYGDGDYIDELKNICSTNDKIKYFGNVLSSEIPEIQKKANLLVNPRPTDGEYTKYSFPSKNMEYMLSGVPLLTTNLPGMPSEYKKYVYLVEDETDTGICNILKSIFSMSEEELSKKGANTREFVLKEKNKHIQGKRIIEQLILK